jgi:uncharacterized protein YbjT (DUF2867 family)
MYVVTGATGNTGNVVAKNLLAQGKKVRAIGRSLAKLQALTAAGVEPFVADVTDAEALTKAFKGAEAVYAMIPPNITSQNPNADQEKIGKAIATAVQNAGVKFVVSLSSIGADKSENSGPVVGLHNQEQRLNKIEGLNVLHLRAGFFMENTLAQIGVIKATGAAGAPLRPDLKLPLIATRDIGTAAAEELTRLEFKGKQTHELQGPRDLSFAEATAIIGRAIGKPDLKYVQLPDNAVRAAMVQMGMSQNMADLILELDAALNSGHVRALEPRTARNSTPTSYENFVAEEFLPQYKQQSVAA